MLENVCAFDSEIYFPTIKRRNGNKIELRVFSYKEDPSSSEYGSFKERTIYHKDRRSNEEFDILGIASVEFFGTGLNRVTMLLRCDDNILYIVSCTNKKSDKFLQKMAKFKISSEREIDKDKIAITDGPTVIFLQQPEILFLFPLMCDTVSFSLKKALQAQLCFSRILHFSCIHTVQDEGNVVVYFLVLAFLHFVTREQSVHMFSVYYNFSKHVMYGEVQDVQLDLFFPTCYQTVISSLSVSFLPSFFNSDENFELQKKGLNWQKNTTIICTQAKQCLIFQKGYMKHFCSIPVSDITHIKVLYSWITFDKWEIVLCSSEGVYWLNSRSDKKLKCVEAWNEASQVLIGDFSRTGSRQLFLMFGFHYNIFPKRFMLVQILPSYCILIPKKVVDVCQYSENAISKLKKKVKDGQLLIMEAQQNTAQKTAYTTNLIEKLINGTLEHECELQEKHNNWLNDIMMHKELEVKRLEIFENEDILEKKLKIIDDWKKFQKGALILGWTLQNISQSCIFKIDGYFFAEWMQSEYYVKVFIHDDDNFGLISSKRSHVAPGEMVSVVFSCQLPVLSENEYEFSCIISWDVGINKEINDEVILGKEKFPHQQMPIHSLFTSDDLLVGKITKCTDLQDLLSFRATQEVILFSISNNDSSIFSFQEFLSQQEYTPKIKEHKNLKWTLFDNDSFIFYGASLTWLHHSADTVEVYAYFRDESEAVALVRWLYGILPYGTIILPAEYSTTEHHQLQRKFLVAMKEEVDLLGASFSHLNLTTVDKKKEETSHLNKDTYLSSRKYYEMKEVLTRREFITDDLLCKVFNLGKQEN